MPSMGRSILSWLGLAVLGAVLVLPATALADPTPAPRPDAPAPAAAKVTVEVMVVHATNAHSKVDSRLESLLPHLRHLEFTGYSVLDTRSDSLGIHQQTSFGIAGGRRMEIELVDKDDSAARMRVRMFKGADRLLDTTVRIHRNRSFIVAGPKHDGGVLILPLTARY